jgi:hypothetical protein
MDSFLIEDVIDVIISFVTEKESLIVISQVSKLFRQIALKYIDMTLNCLSIDYELIKVCFRLLSTNI